ARELYRREQEYLGTLGPSRELASTSLDSGRVEILAGDLDVAERELRRDDRDLEGLHETYFRSTVSALLARVLLLAGNPSEADRYATIAQAMTDESDVDGAVLWRLTRSRLLVGLDPDAAMLMADEAVALAARTEGLILQADALRSRADLLDDLGRNDEAAASRAEAIVKYELKGDRVSAGAARRRAGLESAVAEAH
ncbi:MAG TPA: hypothetical protein VGM49_01850, partial [Candidatus Limnocylindrales bacterium]